MGEATNGTTVAISAKKSYRDGHVAVAVILKERADEAEAKVAAEEARKERRRKWADREVAAGRMIRMNARDFFAK